MNTTPALEVARKYFETSNRSDFASIANMMTDATTYSSATTGMYLGVDSILGMQRVYHSDFTKLQWIIEAIEEEKPGIVRVEFTFKGVRTSGETVESIGTEYVVVHGDSIQHIEIRSR